MIIKEPLCPNCGARLIVECTEPVHYEINTIDVDKDLINSGAFVGVVSDEQPSKDVVILCTKCRTEYDSVEKYVTACETKEPTAPDTPPTGYWNVETPTTHVFPVCKGNKSDLTPLVREPETYIKDDGQYYSFLKELAPKELVHQCKSDPDDNRRFLIASSGQFAFSFRAFNMSERLREEYSLPDPPVPIFCLNWKQVKVIATQKLGRDVTAKEMDAIMKIVKTNEQENTDSIVEVVDTMVRELGITENPEMCQVCHGKESDIQCAVCEKKICLGCIKYVDDIPTCKVCAESMGDQNG